MKNPVSWLELRIFSCSFELNIDNSTKNPISKYHSSKMEEKPHTFESEVQRPSVEKNGGPMQAKRHRNVLNFQISNQVSRKIDHIKP